MDACERRQADAATALLSEEGDTMGYMKDLDRRIRQGGEDAIAAACELAAFPLERLRLLSQHCDCPEPDNAARQDNTLATNATPSQGSEQNGCTLTDAERALLSRLGSDTREWDKYSNGRPWFVRVEGAAIIRGILERLG